MHVCLSPQVFFCCFLKKPKQRTEMPCYTVSVFIVGLDDLLFVVSWLLREFSEEGADITAGAGWDGEFSFILGCGGI